MRRSFSLVILLFFSTGLFAGGVLVTNTDDSGPGSLRQALLDLPGCHKPCTVVFNIGGTSPTGYWTIEPLTPLPAIHGASHIDIDGRTQTAFGGDTNPDGPEVVLSGASAGMSAGLFIMRSGGSTSPVGPFPHESYTIRGLGFENWQGPAVRVSGALGQGLRPVMIRHITIVENYFGVDAHGQIAAPNGAAISMTFVEDAVIASNVITGNGVGISAGACTNVRIARNNIGLDATRKRTLGNATTGVYLTGVRESLVERNVIAGHVAAVAVDGISSVGNAIHRNQMFDNGFGIDLQSDGPTPNDNADLDSGPNGLQNHPVLKLAGRTLRGELESTPGSDFDIDIYETDRPGANQGRRYLGTVTVSTDTRGRAAFSFIIPAGSGPYYTATAMSDSERSTSEFCAPVN